MITDITSFIVALAALAAAIVALIKAGGGLWKEIIGRVEASEKQIKETNEKVEAQQTIINKLVEKSTSDEAFHHLAGITILYEYKYWQNEKVGDLFQRQFYFLKDRGLIGPPTLEFDKELDDTNMVGKAIPTPIGMTYVELRKDDIPKDWLSTDPKVRSNLNIDVVVRRLGFKLANDETIQTPP